MIAWGITDGSAGMASQVEGVLQAVEIPYTLKTIRRRKPWCWLPGWFHWGALSQLEAGSDALSPPWPDLLVTSGRRSAAIAIAIKKASGGKTKTVHLTDPRISPKHFDLVVAMAHDPARGKNVIKTRFALHRLTWAKLREEGERWRERFAHLPKPWVGVLIGGTTNKYILAEKEMRTLIMQLKALHARTGGSLLITPSRRTGEGNVALLMSSSHTSSSSALSRGSLSVPGEEGDPRVKPEDDVFVYDLTGENPYLAILALADSLVVTDDSVNMMSEAAFTGKPLYILPLPDHFGTKPSLFAESLVEDGHARWAESAPQPAWEYEAVEEMQEVAAAIAGLLSIPSAEMDFS